MTGEFVLCLHVDKEFVVSYCHRFFLPLELTAPLVKAVEYLKNLIVVDGLSALAVSELARLLRHMQVSCFLGCVVRRLWWRTRR